MSRGGSKTIIIFYTFNQNKIVYLVNKNKYRTKIKLRVAASKLRKRRGSGAMQFRAWSVQQTVFTVRQAFTVDAVNTRPHFLNGLLLFHSNSLNIHLTSIP